MHAVFIQPPEVEIFGREKFINFSVILVRKRLINGKILKICIDKYIFLELSSFKEYFDVIFSLFKIKLWKLKISIQLFYTIN